MEVCYLGIVNIMFSCLFVLSGWMILKFVLFFDIVFIIWEFCIFVLKYVSWGVENEFCLRYCF